MEAKLGFYRQFVLYIGVTVLFAFVLSGCNGNGDDVVIMDDVVIPPEGWPHISLVKQADGPSLPVHITHAGDGSERLFVVGQVGRIWIIKDGALLSTPFLDISNRVVSGGEQGLLSVAFPPDYGSKGYFYLNYTSISGDGDTVVARYNISGDPNVADPESEQVLLTTDQPFSNHNGGQLAFGPDTYLYIGMGDGGSSGDPLNNAQSPGTLLGKLLRIDVESDPGADPYLIPPDNPFIQNGEFRDEIWALGLRNPWRFSFDRQMGDVYIGDVGQNSYEEIDFQPASSTGGENYGWNIMEGAHCFNSATCDQTGLVLPVAEYDHSKGDCSITGGVVYRGQDYAGLQGIYLYGDFCSGRIWGLRKDGTDWQTALLLDSPYTISTFGEDEAGNLYLADYSSGDIYKIIAQTDQS